MPSVIDEDSGDSNGITENSSDTESATLSVQFRDVEDENGCTMTKVTISEYRSASKSE